MKKKSVLEPSNWDVGTTQVTMIDRRPGEYLNVELALNRSFGGVIDSSGSQDDLEVPDDCSLEQVFSKSDALSKALFTRPSRSQPLPFLDPLSDLDAHTRKYVSANPFYLHCMVFQRRLDLLRRFLNSKPCNLKALLNEKDHRENSPLLLAAKLSHVDTAYLEVARVLLEHGADPLDKDGDGWSVIDEAVAKGDRALAGVVFDYLHEAKLSKIEQMKSRAVSGLEMLPNFYMEIHWEFDSQVIPFVSRLAPSDTCRLWKHGSSLRLDTTLVGWKNLKAKRRNISVLFKGRSARFLRPTVPFDLMLINHSRKLIVNPLEELDGEEREAVLGDIMKNDPVQGDISFQSSTVKEISNWRGQPTASSVGPWSCRKFEIQLNSLIKYKRRGAERMNYTEKEYFANCRGAASQPKYSPYTQTTTQASFDMEEDQGPLSERTAKQRKTKVNCWATKDFPITLKQFLPVLELLSSGHESLSRLHSFLADKSLARYFPEHLFPVKVELPLNLTIKAVVTFTRCTLVKNCEKSVFSIPDYPVASRRIAQKTLSCPRKRLLLTNLFL